MPIDCLYYIHVLYITKNIFYLNLIRKLCNLIWSLCRYYSALKTMEQLENLYLPRVSQYRFCQIMIENLPKLREEIKEISMSDLKDFLESIRKHSDRIGETAMKQVSLHTRMISAPLPTENWPKPSNILQELR